VKSIADRILARARRDNMTIRQLYNHIVAGGFLLIGTPADIADGMQEWFEAGACDGFNILPTHLPVACEDFVELVTPELQRRSLFRTAYEGFNLRANLGLPTHVNRHAAARQAQRAAE
jgi:alkanesulfonate monooxygenase SsuD/methylene tetrahydromethanopterin reductase-like flavin-dependent oxidoreductase (luciferase family)